MLPDIPVSQFILQKTQFLATGIHSGVPEQVPMLKIIPSEVIGYMPKNAGARSGIPEDMPEVSGARSETSEDMPEVSGARSETPEDMPEVSGARSGTPEDMPEVSGTRSGLHEHSIPDDGRHFRQKSVFFLIIH